MFSPRFSPCKCFLWKDGQVSGVVDWVNACVGPVEIDIGHCRVNLALLFGVESADQFLEAYQTLASGSFNYDPYWDVVSICDFFLPGPPEVYSGWKAFGIHDLHNEMMRERADEYLMSVLKQF
jgi:hypothetical protein